MLRRLTFPIWSAPLVLLGVTLAAYGLFAAQQGYAWDDWGIVGVYTLRGPQALLDYFALARPLWGYFYVGGIALIGIEPFAWQVFALLMRWLAAVALWWCLRLLWPRHGAFAFWASAFALVYPGFSQHSIAMVYGQYSLMLAAFYVSLGFSLWGLRPRRGRAVLIILALCLSALHLFSTEYFFGLELVRPALFWVALGESEALPLRRWMQTARAYLPYGLLLGVFLVWRVFFFESQLYDISLTPSALFLSLPAQFADGIWNALAAAWMGVFRLPSPEMGTRLTLIYWVILAAVFAFFVYYPRRLKTEDGDEKARRAPVLQWLGIGSFAALTAGIPFYAANLPVQLKFPDDRFTQPFAFGVSLLLAAALELLPRLSWRTIAAAVLLALAVGAQIQNGFSFRQDWKRQQAYFWQLAWRAPGLKSGVTLLAERSPFQFTDDDALTAPTNWTYMRGGLDGRGVHQLSMATRLNFQTDVMRFDRPIEGKFFASDFIVSADQLLVTQFAPPSCLRVLHPLYDADLPVAPRSREATESLLRLGVPILRREEAAALPLSNIEQIVAAPETPARPPEEIFGAEPPRQWCYYFEKADLARSQGDWEEVARLGDEAFSVPYHPSNPAEYLPFIEAYARLGRLSQAKKLTLDTALQMPILKPSLCALWQRVTVNGVWTDAERFFIQQIQNELRYCPVTNANE